MVRPCKYNWMSWLDVIWGFNQVWCNCSSLQVNCWLGSSFYSLHTFTHNGRVPTVGKAEHQGAAGSTVWGPLTSDPSRLLKERTKQAGYPSQFACSPDWKVESGGGSKKSRESRQKLKAVKSRKVTERKLQMPNEITALKKTVAVSVFSKMLNKQKQQQQKTNKGGIWFSK